MRIGDVHTGQVTGEKFEVIACPDGRAGCEVFHTQPITKPNLEELRELNKKGQTSGLTPADWERIKLADRDDIVKVMSESITLTIESVSVTATKKS